MQDRPPFLLPLPTPIMWNVGLEIHITAEYGVLGAVVYGVTFTVYTSPYSWEVGSIEAVQERVRGCIVFLPLK